MRSSFWVQIPAPVLGPESGTSLELVGVFYLILIKRACIGRGWVQNVCSVLGPESGTQIGSTFS